MRLKAVEIREYRSIRNSNRFEVGDVTCIVGKNESGKTSLLQALYKLNPVIPEHGTFDVTDQYPRADVEEYRQQTEAKQREPAVVVEAEYLLDVPELTEIEEVFGKGVIPEPSLTLSKGYQNEVRVNLGVSETAAVKGLVQKAGLPVEVAEPAGKLDTLEGLEAFLAADGQRRDQAYADAQAKANALPDPDEKAKALHQADTLAESQAAKKLRGLLAAVRTVGLSLHVWNHFLKAKLPKFLYFDEYYQMVGHVNLDKLRQRMAGNSLLVSDRPLLGLIELARLNLDQLMNPQSTEVLISRLEGASNHLSKQILKYWSQNQHLHVRFDVRPAQPGDPEDMRSGTNLWGRVFDSVHEVTTLLANRSRGFLWFFSFLAWFWQQRKSQESLILLLDEPGLFLHAKAQGDLLRYREEELKPHHQVVYSTHSPFMVDPQRFERVRIVEDKSIDKHDELAPDEKGTKVFTDVLRAGEATLFPLQGALGYDIAQTLFVGPNCLIVEGVSDLLYLQAITGLLEENGRQGLDRRWTITPVGGSEKVPTFAALLGSQKGLTIATLIDLQRKDVQVIENLYKRKLLQKSHVLTFADFTATPEADIEDMFEAAFYLKLVGTEYAKDLTKKPKETDLGTSSSRIVVRLSEYFKVKPLKGTAQFNHYRPARYFAENVGTLKKDITAETMDRFEAAFVKLNGLLK